MRDDGRAGGCAQASVILGTSRSYGNTKAMIDLAFEGLGIPVIDLAGRNIGCFDYGHGNQGDDFLPLVQSLMAQPLWIFATPVYWYAMSAQLKIFFDRLSDLITLRKDIGRALSGKYTAVMASGSDRDLPTGFEVPFERTSHYFGMNYLGCFYTRFEQDTLSATSAGQELRNWAAQIFGSLA